jgi:hypothetical protein
MIEGLNESSLQHYNPQPIFKQQVGIDKGIIDGHIEIQASKIIIEAKLNTKESIEKLVKYAKVFNENSQNQLWHLSSIKFDNREESKIKNELNNNYPNINIQFNNLSYSDLVDNLEGIFEENLHDTELRLLLEDFSNYCTSNGLITNEEYKLLFVPTGYTFGWNMKHKLYYCPINWHSQKFKFFGFYNLKSVKSISTIETVIEADYYTKNKELIVKSDGHTPEQISRLQKGLDEIKQDLKGLKFYVLPENEFYETDFRKISHGGIRRYRYEDLRDYVSLDNYDDIKSIAEELKKVNWK